jgi:cell division protease FtsH
VNSTVKQVITWVVLAIAAILLWQVVRSTGGQKEKEINLSEFTTAVDQGTIADATIRGNEVTGKFKTNDKVAEIYHTTIPANYPDIYKQLKDKGVSVKIVDPQTAQWVNLVVGTLPFVLIIAFWIFMMRQMQAGGNKAMSFGKSRARLLSM